MAAAQSRPQLLKEMIDHPICYKENATETLHPHVLSDSGELAEREQSQLTSVGLPVRLQGIFLGKLGSALITDKGFGTRCKEGEVISTSRVFH